MEGDEEKEKSLKKKEMEDRKVKAIEERIKF